MDKLIKNMQMTTVLPLADEVEYLAGGSSAKLLPKTGTTALLSLPLPRERRLVLILLVAMLWYFVLMVVVK